MIVAPRSLPNRVARIYAVLLAANGAAPLTEARSHATP